MTRSFSAYAALHDDGSVSVWGSSTHGGDNAPDAVTKPDPGVGVVGVAASEWSFAAVHANGAVTHWGKPTYGGGGVPGHSNSGTSGAQYDYTSPGSGAAVVSVVSADGSFAALHSNGAVTSWGQGQFLSGSSTTNIPIPDRVTSPAQLLMLAW